MDSLNSFKSFIFYLINNLVSAPCFPQTWLSSTLLISYLLLCPTNCVLLVFSWTYSKAFDTTDQEILVSKLSFSCVRGCALKWFSNYLADRQQYTLVNNFSSAQGVITHGVSQGSILGPLLFLVYINDLHNSSSLLSFLLFADDTTVIYSDSSFQSLTQILNSELIQVSSWFTSNKLSLTPGKLNVFFSVNLIIPIFTLFLLILTTHSLPGSGRRNSLASS